jgi:transposase-like protein/IS1 family transposase
MRIERLIIILLGGLLAWALWKLYKGKVHKMWQRVKDHMPRQWRPKSPEDCPWCQDELEILVVPSQPEVTPYGEVKSSRGRKKTVSTQSFACPEVTCKYFGITDEAVHALVGYGKLGMKGDIQRFKCQACGGTFSSRKGTPLYYVKSAAGQVEEVLWYLVEGVDISVLVRRTGHKEETLSQWLNRMGEHSARLHDLIFRQLELELVQMDELYAKVRGTDETRWLWLAIDPVTKILPALHLGGRRATDAYALVHELKRRLCATCVPAFTTDGLRAYFHAVTAHFGRWFRPRRARKDHWQVDEDLLHGQLVKRRQNRKVKYTITRMLWGKRSELYDVLEQYGFNRLVQTSVIERVNLTIRQGVSLLTRRTWSLAQTDAHLLNHVQWWRCYYHFIRPHETLRDQTPGIPRAQRDRTPAMAAGLTDHIWTVEEVLRLPLLTRLDGSPPAGGNACMACAA